MFFYSDIESLEDMSAEVNQVKVVYCDKQRNHGKFSWIFSLIFFILIVSLFLLFAGITWEELMVVKGGLCIWRVNITQSVYF